GVPVAAIVARCQPLAAARYIQFVSFDSDYSNGWDMASALHPQTILAYGMNDNPLPPAHGAPLRLYSPTKLGYKLTKYLVAMTFTDKRPGGYWEDQGYPWFGGIWSIAARASCISAAVWYLSPRSLAIALRITWASASGTSALNLRGSGAGSSRCFATTAYTDSPSNGTRPATHSNRTTPAAYRSLRASSSIPN